LFPFPHELTVEARLKTGALRIATTLVPIGRESVPVSFGSHPYLRILDETRSRWRIALGAPERLLLDDAMIPTGEREAVAAALHPCGAGPRRRVRPPRPTRGVRSGGGRTAMRVEFLEGYAYAQVYAPAGRDFICFEPMTAPTNALVSGDGRTVPRSGGQYRAAFRVSVSSVPRHRPRDVAGR
jgi:aldose 1-epimerase